MTTTPHIIPVVVVVQPRVLLLDVAGPVEVLRKANLIQSDIHFDVRYVGPEPECGSSVGLRVAGLGPLPDRVSDGAIVLLPGNADYPINVTPGGEVNREAEATVVDWLKTVIRPGIRLASICSGAVLAGKAGLFDGYACTTHHATIAQLAQAAPAATVLTDRLYVEDGERLSSAGITAGIDLMLHIVAGLLGPAAAVEIARYMVVYMRRGGADPQMSPWLEGRNHIHPAIHRVQDVITADPARDWSVEALAREAGFSPRNLSRLFNEHAGMSVTDFVNRMRIMLATELLKGTRLDIESVAERSGFASPRQMRRAWARYHPQPPSRVRLG